MHPNAQLIRAFYTAFQKKDYKAMQDCYAPDAAFRDPVFQDLDAGAVKAMWEMLLGRSKDLSLEFADVAADDHSGSARWTATYTFGATGRKVVNRISARFEFRDGKIFRHTDTFDFYAWARQAFGLSGWLLGWTPFFKSKVRRSARSGLDAFRANRT